jgi:hypothetical protein
MGTGPDPEPEPEPEGGEAIRSACERARPGSKGAALRESVVCDGVAGVAGGGLVGESCTLGNGSGGGR